MRYPLGRGPYCSQTNPLSGEFNHPPILTRHANQIAPKHMIILGDWWWGGAWGRGIVSRPWTWAVPSFSYILMAVRDPFCDFRESGCAAGVCFGGQFLLPLLYSPFCGDILITRGRCTFSNTAELPFWCWRLKRLQFFVFSFPFLKRLT